MKMMAFFGIAIASIAHAATEGEVVSINIAEDNIFVTNLQTSLRGEVSGAVLEQIESKCSPLKGATNVDLHIQLNRWVHGDTQSVAVNGTATCSLR